MSYFNSQPHEEADKSAAESKIDTIAFQLTASRRGWLPDVRVHLSFSPFQLTASRRGWRNSNVYAPIVFHFNSQPHEEADKMKQEIDELHIISTHSLTKRLTLERVKYGGSTAFQLTASRRGWHDLDWEDIVKLLFQLTASRRGWPTLQKIDDLRISFQLTASRRGWPIPPLAFAATGTFQLTASRRGWHLCRRISSCYNHFNSQPHEEADSNSVQKFLVQNCVFCNYYIYCFLCSSLIQFFAYFFYLNYPFAGANAPEKVVCLSFALIISRYL